MSMAKNNEHNQQNDVEKKEFSEDLIEQFEIDEEFIDVLTEGMKDYRKTLKDLMDR